MNYSRIYDKIISNAQACNRIRLDRSDVLYVYYENHHIIPKCVGGTDAESNLVLLLPEEHYVVHQLLVKMYPDVSGLVYALIKMSGPHYGRNNKLYSWIKRHNSQTRSKSMKNKPWSINRRTALINNPVIMSAESNRLRKLALTGRKTSTGNLGHVQTADTKLKKLISNPVTIAVWFLSPENTEVLCIGINKFSKENMLNVGTIRTMIDNPDKEYKGWKFLRRATLNERGTQNY